MMKIFQLLPKTCFGRRVQSGIQKCFYSSKKGLLQPIAAKCNIVEIERGWYEWWEENGFFRRHDAEEKFVMILPPPNITGHLHLGHALTCAIQDALARWHQMNGKNVVWVPGCDHAGIATQVVVEQHLWAVQQTTRHQLGRERFLNEIVKWKDQKGMKIYDQMKRMGVSLDWDRAIYTMDENMCKSVSEAFIKLFNSGLVYRKKSMVNWCCQLESVISNIEVEHLELQEPTALSVPGYEEPVKFGHMYDFAYRICDSDEEIVVSTTRPETMLGDTAVMVNPEDERYKQFLGKQVFHPFRRDSIPVIADSCVDPEFGTGAVKVTPAHSVDDFEVGRRHNLQEITVFDEKGLITLSEFTGQHRFKARTSILDALNQLGLYRGCKPHSMMVPRCSRTKDIIEPMIKSQWFINVKDMANKAVQAVQTGKLEIYPPNYKTVWYEWLANNIQDWCISRQLWWGHRIPAYCICVDGAQDELWIAASSEEEAIKRFTEETGLPASSIKSIKQDNDVLDTWFSSGLLPFAAFGWPWNSDELGSFYPTTLLDTGHDILFFWVARMVMLGQELTGKLPFKTVLFHGLINDAEGRKMSKSRGNVLDPMDVIDGATLKVLNERIVENEKQGVISKEEVASALKHQKSCFPNGIPQCGADALRFSLCSYSFKNCFVAIDINRIEQNKFFCNKIWQVMRFLLAALERDDFKCCTHVQFSDRDNLGIMDKWILSNLSALVSNAQQNFSTFNLHRVVEKFYHFWYKCLCDVYLESIKPTLRSSDVTSRFAALQTLWSCVDVSLRVLSPFMPFLTEELYHYLPRLDERKDSIMQCYYPQPNEWECWRDSSLEKKVEVILEVSTALRALKDNYVVAGRSYKDMKGSIITGDQDIWSTLNESKGIVERLAFIGSLSVYDSSAEPPPMTAASIISSVTSVYLHLEGLIDPEMEVQRLDKKIAKLRKTENIILKKMSVKRYADKTPLHIQKSNDTKLAALRTELKQFSLLLESVKKMQC